MKRKETYELKRKSDKPLQHSIKKKCASVLFLSLYALFSFWLFWPYNPIEINDIKILNPNKEIAPDGFLIYEMDIDKKLPLAATIHKQLINDFIITYSSIYSNIPVGKRKMKVKIKIPKSAELGDYVFKWEGVYQVNPIRKVSVSFISDSFVVKNSWDIK